MNAQEAQRLFVAIATVGSIGAAVVTGYEVFKPAPPSVKKGLLTLTFLGTMGGSAFGLYTLLAPQAPTAQPAVRT